MSRLVSITTLCAIAALVAAMPIQIMSSPEPSMEPTMMQAPEPSLQPLPFIPKGLIPVITPKPDQEAELGAEATPKSEPEQEGVDVHTPIVATVQPTPTIGSPDAIAVNEQAGTEKHPEHSKRPRNEGCVAIEHLRGYVLQHPHHLRRHVLCANAFCATPNHAIIVDGQLTSMKLLCDSQWQCVESIKLVNNLKISKNRRAKVSDHIVVTPYDLRFPKAASWIAQIAEDVWYLMSSSTILGALLATAAFVVNKSKLL